MLKNTAILGAKDTTLLQLCKMHNTLKTFSPEQVSFNSEYPYLSAKDFKKSLSAEHGFERHYLGVVEDFILQDGYPCMGAQSAVNGKTFAVGIFNSMQDEDVVPNLIDGLSQYLENVRRTSSAFMTYIAIFIKDQPMDEAKFEDELWSLLSRINACDSKKYAWSESVSSNPADENFSFSIMGEPFFLVGLHPKSSRRSRRFKYSGIAFNLHSQFEKLREKGRYHQLKNAIRKNDCVFSGSINPMLSDFGDGLEAAQYSGRAVDENWKCPFNPANDI